MVPLSRADTLRCLFSFVKESMPLATYSLGPPTHPRITHDNGFLDRYAPRKPLPLILRAVPLQ